MDKYAPKFSTVLLTPDPHYIPGYTGYCPQLKYNVGKSYAKLTAELLTSPDVKHSSQLVLHTGEFPSTEPKAFLQTRSIPDKYSEKMIPGYTGFIPRRQNYFACSYSETCQRALSEFYQEKEAKSQRKPLDLPVVKTTGQQFEVQRPKVPAVQGKMDYKPLRSFSPCRRPYFLEDDNPHKYFMSGFTGHVPKSRFLFGKGYPIITKQALIQFGRQQQSDPIEQDDAEGTDTKVPTMRTIYPPNRGMVPSFTGHIPGYKFMYGSTFGQLSKNALEKSGIKRIQQQSRQRL